MRDEQFVGSVEACRRYGIAPLTLRRRIETGELVAYADPMDRRRRLLRVAELERLREPRPIVVRGTAAGVAA